MTVKPTKDSTISIKNVNELSASADNLRKFADAINKDVLAIKKIIDKLPDYWESEGLQDILNKLNSRLTQGYKQGGSLLDLRKEVCAFADFLDAAYEIRIGTEKTIAKSAAAAFSNSNASMFN